MGLMNMQLGMKRSREISDQFDSITTMANSLMLLSGAGGDQFQVLSSAAANYHHQYQYRDVSPSRVFECKTCNRQFPSFQALGGHRASHKKPKISGDLGSPAAASPAKPKTHECSICGQEFSVGQALGGHMRRHRAAAAVIQDSNSDQHLQSPVAGKNLNRKNIVGGSKRVWGMDLNLTPLENDVLEFGLGKAVYVSPAELGGAV